LALQDPEKLFSRREALTGEISTKVYNKPPIQGTFFSLNFGFKHYYSLSGKRPNKREEKENWVILLKLVI